MKINTYLDQIDDLANDYNPFDRRERRKRKKKVHHAPKKAQQAILQELADAPGLEVEFKTTYTPSIHEAEWLTQSLQPFFVEQKITDILALVKGGKEASVYLCEAHESTGFDYLAVKVYRPRMFRNLRNDKMYREGREELNAEGRAIKVTDQRTMKALKKKSAYGAQISHQSWLMYEYSALETLYNAGANVPQPLAVGENAILMTYVGELGFPAPILQSVALEEDEAQDLFNEVMHMIELMLQHHMIHGDLSAYNVLYWDGEVTFIDFPQIVSPDTNSNAYNILNRDITRICEYFASQGVDSDPDAITNAMWDRYIGRDEVGVLADMSRYEVEVDED